MLLVEQLPHEQPAVTGLEAALDYLRRLLDQYEENDERSLWILPTTAQSLAFIEQAKPSIALAIAAPHLGKRHDLPAFVEHLPEASVAISFADQLTSPLAAPWLVECDHQRTFLSRVEFVAQAELGFRLSVWTTYGFLTLPLAAKEIVVGRALLRYLVSCEQLGSDWLASAAQCDRSPVLRVVQSAKRLQLFRSAVLASSMAVGLTPTARATLKRGSASQKELLSSQVAG